MPYAALENTAPERARAAHRDERLSPPSALIPDLREEIPSERCSERAVRITLSLAFLAPAIVRAEAPSTARSTSSCSCSCSWSDTPHQHLRATPGATARTSGTMPASTP